VRAANRTGSDAEMPHCAKAVVRETYLACWYTERDGQDASPALYARKVRSEVGINDNREFARHFLEIRTFRKNLTSTGGYEILWNLRRAE